MGRKGTYVVGLLALGALIGGLAGAGRAPLVSPSEPAVTGSSAPVATFQVHVAGWVVRPGVVTVAEGSIVADVIEAAGGMRSGARPDLINLAEPVQPGQQVVLPGPDSASGGAVSSDGLISLNGADASTLETLPGVGPVLAERIVAFREQNGPFQQVEGLLEVPGIGEAKLASLRDLVRVP
jgi:competence protein ComEA